MPEKRTIEARGKRRNKNNQSSFHPLLFRAFSFDSPLLRDTVEREREIRERATRKNGHAAVAAAAGDEKWGRERGEGKVEPV